MLELNNNIGELDGLDRLVDCVLFLIAFAFSALRWACAGLTDFSLAMVAIVK